MSELTVHVLKKDMEYYNKHFIEISMGIHEVADSFSAKTRPSVFYYKHYNLSQLISFDWERDFIFIIKTFNSAFAGPFSLDFIHKQTNIIYASKDLSNEELHNELIQLANHAPALLLTTKVVEVD
jgi:thioredoxin-related protein